MRRRDFVALAGLSAAGFLGLRYITGGVKSVIPEKRGPGLKEVTPNEEFYLTQYNGIPEVDGESWRLEIEGEVKNPVSLSLDEIMGMGSGRDYNTLICIGNGIGGDLIGNARWRGVRLEDVLNHAGLLENAAYVLFHGADGYSDGFPLERALHPGTRLVYEMNGEPLPVAHGFPLRAVVPGLYGIKNLKWITKIEVLSEPVTGYWGKRGWNKDGFIKVMSRVDSPGDGSRIEQGPLTISGIAFAGEHMITRVEVSTDGENTWTPAELRKPLSDYAWTLWSLDWVPDSTGDFRISVRAEDASGRIQGPGSIVSRRSFPDGADGYHRINVRII